MCALFVEPKDDVELDTLNIPALIEHANESGLTLWTFILTVTVLSFQGEETLRPSVVGKKGFSFGSNRLLDYFTWTLRKYMSNPDINNKFTPFDKSDEVFSTDADDGLNKFSELETSTEEYALVKNYFGAP